MVELTDPNDVSEDIRNYQANTYKFMRERGWDMPRLAREAKLSNAHVNNLIAGRTAGSVYCMIKIARALRVGLDDLVAPPSE